MTHLQKGISGKPVKGPLEAVLDWANRELLPLLKEMRSRVNDLLSWPVEDARVPFPLHGVIPTAGTVATYAPLDALQVTVVVGVGLSASIDPSLYPEKKNGQDRAIYWRLFGFQTPPGAAVVFFALYNVDDAEVVIEAEAFTAALDPVMMLVGPLTVGDLPGMLKSTAKNYAVYGRREGGTIEDAYCTSSEFVVRYE